MWWIIIIIIILLILILINLNYKIPKIIWSYWDGPKNEMVEKCISSWNKMCPDYKIVILNNENLQNYIQDDVLNLKFADSPARTSDFIRLAVLEKHGGIWIDATTILTQPLDWVHNGREFTGYYKEGNMTRKEYPCIESWFLACTPGSQFIALWKDEFFKINNYNSIKEYVDTAGVDMQNIGEREYLTIYVAVQKVLQNQMEPSEAWSRFKLRRLEDSQQHWWNVRLLCDPNRPAPDVIKFNRYARAEMDADPTLKCAYMSHA
jgi:hypothetical protein